MNVCMCHIPMFVLIGALSFPGAGLLLCIEKALAQSGVSKEDVNYVNAHATSTRAGDLQEYKALMEVFGQNPQVMNGSSGFNVEFSTG